MVKSGIINYMRPILSNITTDLFLKNIKNLPAIIAACDMLETIHIAQNTFYDVINESKIQFLNSTTAIFSGLEIITSGNLSEPATFDYEQLFLIRKNIATFDLESDELLKVVKIKFDELIDFISLIRENFANLNFSEPELEKIRQEILIVRYELSHRGYDLTFKGSIYG